MSPVLRLLRDFGGLSRSELASRLDIPRPRLRTELEPLQATALVRVAGPAAGVELHPDLRFAAVDLGATSIDVEITDGHLRPVAAYAEPADIRSGPKILLARLGEILDKFKVEGAYRRLSAVGIGLPGPVSFREGCPIPLPTMPGWDRFPVRDVLSREHACPVVVDNDANVMAVGERYGGVASSVDNLLFVKVGTGIGCGIVLNGALYRGADGCAGDIGHLPVDRHGPVCACGNVGCLETVFGGAALARNATVAARTGASAVLAQRLATAGFVTARDVAHAVADGDPASIELVRTGGRRLGTVVAGLVNIVNPAMIVIGGGVAGLGHCLLGEIRDVVHRRSLPLATSGLAVVRSELGARAGVVGAAVLASDLAFGLSPSAL
jgi:glucokinase-like ROK family protein